MLDPKTNVEPDLPLAADRQKLAWGKVAREVQEMNERDHERFKAALTRRDCPPGRPDRTPSPQRCRRGGKPPANRPWPSSSKSAMH